MHTKDKEIVYLKDKVINILLTDKDTKEYVESLISATLNIPKYIVKDNLELRTQRVNSNINTQYSEVDAIFENNTSIINIEVNYTNYKTLNVKNMKYVCHLILKQTRTNERYSKLKPVYQININNFDVFGKNKFIYRSSIIEETILEKRNDFLSIIDINIDFLRDIDYTKIMEGENSLEKLLYIFVCNDNEILDKLYINDEIMDKVREKISALTEDFDKELYYNKQEIINNYSYDLGVEETKVKIIKNLLEMNMSKDDIAKATNLTIEEVIALLNNE